MNTSAVTRYGWVVALLSVVALWLRVEGQQGSHVALAAPSGDQAERIKPASIAVIDVAVIFKKFEKFNQQMGELKKEIEIFDQYVKEQSSELKELADRLLRVQKGSQEEKDLTLQAELQTKTLQDEVAAKKADLLKVEAHIYFDRYKDVEAAAKLLARERKIDFLLRFNGEEMKREDRNTVLQGVNRAVIIFPEQNDVTVEVIKILNES